MRLTYVSMCVCVDLIHTYTHHTHASYDDDNFFSGFFTRLGAGRYDFLLIPPVFAGCSYSYELSYLLTRVQNVRSLPDSQVRTGGLILTRAGNTEINRFQDLKNKIIRTTA